MAELKTSEVELRPAIEYPERGEIIISERYTFRVGAPEDAAVVEVCIDDGPWNPCRQAAGHWWYDWTNYEAGTHDIVARCVTREGRAYAGLLRNFVASFPIQNGQAGS